VKASPRKILGRKVKNLRRDGFLPGNVFGKKVKSLSIAVLFKDFMSAHKKVGETGLIELSVDGEVRPVLIHSIQYDPMNHAPLHADFYQVDLKEKVKANVPVELNGEAPAVSQKVGVLLQEMDEVEVEALPADLPEKIVLDISNLLAEGQELKVSDLKISDKVKILTDVTRIVVKVAPLVSEEAKKMAEEEAAAAAAKAAEATAAAPAAPGEAPVPEAPAKEEPKKA